jgi:hypothetical protein
MTKRILAVDGVPVDRLIRKNWATPGTEGERAADTATQAEHRELIARQRFLERRREVQWSRFNSLELARDRDEQLRISRELDEIQAELDVLREQLAAFGPRDNAGSDRGFAKTDRARGADALHTIMHTPTIRKDDLPDVFGLDNSLGLRSQPTIK